jgi:hypothetical protein
LLTKKHYDYLLFKEVIELMLKKEHNTLEGLQKIVNLKASINLGLSNVLKEFFPDTIPIKREEKDSTAVIPAQAEE